MSYTGPDPLCGGDSCPMSASPGGSGPFQLEFVVTTDPRTTGGDDSIESGDGENIIIGGAGNDNIKGGKVNNTNINNVTLLVVY